ncbi:ABC transporter permease subunit [Photobacterium sp. TY1-4]|uniref:ABC transporter permease subunit n=1 Tax=Photobacterium sp. TY1-4 TaxID=2899122 RepID=UPI0021C1B0B9|nr:ABC transporter permease subunit [Photobacterium sp. TY1-4]UXI00739.1 ABC transporter permease subunit [Photobacterium sp. TY1-4]
MADAGDFLRGDSPGRRVKDKLARYGVTAGGIFVLVTLVLIFFYLLYVMMPIFASVRVTSQQAFTASFSDQPAAIRVSEQNDLAYRLSTQGTLSVVSIDGAQAGQVIRQFKVMAQPTSVAQTLPREEIFAYGNGAGQVVLFKPVAGVTFSEPASHPAQALFKPQTMRQSHPEITYPLGRDPIQLDPQQQPVIRLAASLRDDRGVIAGVTADQRLRVATFEQSVRLQNQQGTWQSRFFAVDGVPGQIEALAVTPDARTLYALGGQWLYVVALRGEQSYVREVVDLGTEPGSASQLTLLSGANSLLIRTGAQEIAQWFEVLRDGQRQMVKAREFKLAPGSPAAHLVPEYSRKGFFAVQQDGTLSAFYTTVKGPIYQETRFEQVPAWMAISPRADRLLTVNGDQWQVYRVNNRHPEIGIASLWQKIWYEGYPEPAYVWQSTSASDEFEPKLSLVPVVFGTLKAALYAMVFAIPLALAGAIYTAYFMSSAMRQVIKPTVEIMEALPTVILGFLAGIWLAPVIETHLPGVLLMILAFPLAMLVVGLIWSLLLPAAWRVRLPGGLHLMVLVPVIILLAYGCLSLGPWLEQALFDGDLRVYLASEWGIGYDQRNTLVVGIAMGFAVIPTVFTIAEDAIFSVPGHLTSGSLALGATHWQTLTRVVLLTASPGIFSAIMMGLGRAVGETMIVLMATGNTPLMDWNILEGLRTLSATIAIEMPESEVGSSHYRVLFLAAFVLFVFTFLFNTIAELVRQRLRERYSSL